MKGIYEKPDMIQAIIEGRKTQTNDFPYIYTWGNNPKRATLKGRKCRVLARLALNSCVVQFENGQKEVVSRNALKRDLSIPSETRRASE